MPPAFPMDAAADAPQEPSFPKTALRRQPLFYALILVITLFSQFWPASVNDGSRMALVESLLERKVFWTDESMYFNRNDMVFYRDHFYSDKQPLLPLYTTAVLSPVHALGVRFGTEGGRWILYYLAVLTSSGLALLLIFAFLGRALRLIRADAEASFWISAWVCFGSCLLPFGMIYSSHVVEAALIFIAFTYLLEYRALQNPRAPFLSGLCLGLSMSIHLVAGTLFAGMTALYFLTCRFRDFLKFSGVTLALAAAALGINVLEHGDVKFPYMMPETFLYAGSSHLNHADFPGLTVQKINARFAELGLDDTLREQMIERFHAFKKKSSNPLVWAKHQYLLYTFLVFSPIFLMGLASALRGLWNKTYPWKRETLWALGGSLILYLALLHLKSQPGRSFGDRHLIPVIPLITFFAAFHLARKENLAYFKVIFWVFLAMMCLGVAQPWETPNQDFLRVNAWISFGCLAIHLLALAVKPFGRGLSFITAWISRRRWLLPLLFLLLLKFEMDLYARPVTHKPRSPFFWALNYIETRLQSPEAGES